MSAQKDSTHWLYRFTVEEWLAAADNELGLCESALHRRAFRPGNQRGRDASQDSRDGHPTTARRHAFLAPAFRR